MLRVVLSILLGIASAGLASADIVFLYDDLGRLVRVIDERGEAADYRYDPVGNLLEISRQSGLSQTTTVSSISSSRFVVGESSTVLIMGGNLLGAVVSGSPGITVTQVRTELDALQLRVFVGQGVSPGPASLTIRTDLGTITLPITIVPSPAVITTVAGSGINAEFVGPNGVAADGQGGVLVADGNQIRRVSADGTITRIAGVPTGEFGFNGDGIPAISAWLFSPQGVAVDAEGNVFVADTDNDRIRKVSPDGMITTVAGSGLTGFSGDGGPETGAQLHGPFGVAPDGRGALFIADTFNHRVRKVSADGTITTVAGTGVQGGTGDGGPALSAELNSPVALALDSQGALFIADWGNHRIRMVSPGGTISTVAGSGLEGFEGDGGPAPSARLNHPLGVALDGQGALLIADTDNLRIRKVGPDGTIATVAGTGVQGVSGDGGPASSAELAYPQTVAVDSRGTMFIADTGNARVRAVADDGIITSLAGPLDRGFSGDGGPANRALLNTPMEVVVDAEGRLFIADADNHRIRRVGVDGTVTTVAGSGDRGSSGDGGPATSAELDFPWGLAVDGRGNLFIADAVAQRIRRVGADGTITTVAGTGQNGFAGDGGPATSAQLDMPSALALDGQGNLFIADMNNNRIRRVAADGTISTVAGNGATGFAGDGGPATGARLFFPAGVAVDPQGVLFIADTVNRRVRRVGTDGVITTVAGTGSSASNGDGGPATAASLAWPEAVAVDGQGNLFIVESHDSRVRKVSADGTITTVAGIGEWGFSGDGGPAVGASLRGPSGVAVDGQGNLFIADTYNNRIRRVGPGQSEP